MTITHVVTYRASNGKCSVVFVPASSTEVRKPTWSLAWRYILRVYDIQKSQAQPLKNLPTLRPLEVIDK